MSEESKCTCFEINNSSNNPQSDVKLSSSFYKDYSSFCNKNNAEAGVKNLTNYLIIILFKIIK